jgi:hypothetical protein
MQLPKLVLLKKQSAEAMRLRGRWWPGKRILEVAPRLYNASMNFFVEIFLHEMCHQAVSEIDRVNETVNKGHGPYWSKWMTHVGLNPLRFDPNDNTEYMSKKELEQKQMVRKSELDLVPITPMPNTPASIMREGRLLNGMLVGPSGKYKGKPTWAFVSEIQMETYSLNGTLSWLNTYATNVYEFKGDLIAIPKWLAVLDAVRKALARR